MTACGSDSCTPSGFDSANLRDVSQGGCPKQEKVSGGGWGVTVVMKLFKTVWCSRRRRAGRFNVHQANHFNHGIDKLHGIIKHSDNDLFICAQVGVI